MFTEFNSFEQIAEQFPGAYEMIMEENDAQYPNAKFVAGAVGKNHPSDEELDIMVLFDVGTPDQVLWVWVSGDITDPVPNRGSFIDEYYEVSLEEGTSYLNGLRY